jgi:hypothetical protein
MPGLMRQSPATCATRPAMFAEYTAHGFHGGNSLALRTILGPPRSLDDFFAELAR